MNSGIEFAQKINLAYNSVCKPLLHKLNLPQTAFDILMFLANNPEYTTARDIVEVRKIKANLVSVNVDRLVGDGYIIRKETEGDRRKTQLICTPAAGFTDLRRGIDGLAGIIQFQFELDPHDKDTIFLFCGRRNDRIKALL